MYSKNLNIYLKNVFWCKSNENAFICFRTKSESPASSLSSTTPIQAAQGNSSQQPASIQPPQTSTTAYGFQLREDQGRVSTHYLILNVNLFIPEEIIVLSQKDSRVISILLTLRPLKGATGIFANFTVAPRPVSSKPRPCTTVTWLLMFVLLTFELFLPIFEWKHRKVLISFLTHFLISHIYSWHAF